MFGKLRAFADIGRTQGITTTATISIVGALTSTSVVEWYHIVYFTVLSIFAHMALNTYIALGDGLQKYYDLKFGKGWEYTVNAPAQALFVI